MKLPLHTMDLKVVNWNYLFGKLFRKTYRIIFVTASAQSPEMRISLCTDSWFELCYSIISAAEKPISQDLVYLQVGLHYRSFKKRNV